MYKNDFYKRNLFLLLTYIPLIKGLKKLNCSKCCLLDCLVCPLLTFIPHIEGLYRLECCNCCALTNIFNIKSLKILCLNCPWLYNQNEKFNGRIQKLIILQRISKRIIKRKRFVKYIKTREFNEWFYAPNGIGGKTHKKNMLNYLQEIK